MRGQSVTAVLDPVLEVLDGEDWPLLGAILLLPWAFGGVEIWAYRGAAFLVALSAAMTLWKRGWSGLGGGRSLWLLPALLLGLWAALQLVPLPPAVVAALSPTADGIYRETFPGYPGAAPDDVAAAVEARALERVPEAESLPLPPREGRFLGPELAGRWSGWRALSLLPRAGLERLHWYAALLLAFLLVRERVRDEERFHAYRNAVFGNFVALALVGIVHTATGEGTLLWVRDVRSDASPFGPYVNPDHFAGLMELAVPWLAGYALATARRAGGGFLGLARTPIFGVGALVCLAASLAAASKASAVLLAASLTVLAIAAAPGLRSRLAVVVLAALVWVGAAFALQDSRLAERATGFLESTGGDLAAIDRLVVLEAAVPMFRDFTIVGSGFGSFREVFGHYLPRGEYLVWEQLHNDYFEVVVEGGVIAAVLLAWLLVVYWHRVLRPSAWRDAAGADLECVGLMLGLLALSLHGLVDFNHQIPANALTFVALAAILVARGEVRRGTAGVAR